MGAMEFGWIGMGVLIISVTQMLILYELKEMCKELKSILKSNFKRGFKKNENKSFNA